MSPNLIKFIGFGATDVVKPYEFIGFGAMDVTKPHEFIGFGAMDVTKPHEFMGFGAMNGGQGASGTFRLGPNKGTSLNSMGPYGWPPHRGLRPGSVGKDLMKSPKT